MSDFVPDPSWPTNGTVQGPCADNEFYWGTTCGCGGTNKRPVCRPAGIQAVAPSSQVQWTPPIQTRPVTSYTVVYKDGTKEDFEGRQMMLMQQRCSSRGCLEKYVNIRIHDITTNEVIEEKVTRIR